MAKGPLRRSLEDWADTLQMPNPIKDYMQRVNDRFMEIYAFVHPFRDQYPVNFFIYSIPIGVFTCLYMLTGWRIAYDVVYFFAVGPSAAQVGDSLGSFLSLLFTGAANPEFVDHVGTKITDPLFKLFEDWGNDDTTDPKLFARRFHGFLATLSASGAIVEYLSEVTSGGIVKTIGNLETAMYWNFGLGFLGWQTMAPILSAGLQPGLTRYYNKLYRPMRFNASQMRDLYALGEVTQNQVAEELRSEGWRDQDINQWVSLAFRTLGEADIWQAWQEGKITQGEASARLRALGYDPSDIPLLFELNPIPPQNVLKDTSESTLRTAFRDGLISEGELRAGLAVLKYKPETINLLVSIDQLTVTASKKSLNVGQIKAAWTDNVIGDVEAAHYLSLEGFDSTQVTLLLDTWKAEITPVYRKVNAATILEAYVYHVYNRVQAHDRLVEVGYLDPDATLELDLTELRNPSAFGNPAPPPPRLLTPGTLGNLLAYGLISQAQMIAYLEQLHYSQEDAALLTQAAIVRATPQPKPLPVGSLENAYRYGVITRDIAKELLERQGYSADSAETLLTTLEAQYPQDFGAPPEVRVKSLPEATLVDLTVSGVITTDTLRTRLEDLNYADHDIDLILTRVAQLMAPPVRVLTESTVLSGYLVGIFSREETLSRLAAMNISAEDAEALVATFEGQHPEVFNPGSVQAVRQPTIAALVAAVQKGLITEDEYTARAQEIGYTPPDSALYLALATKNERKSVVQLSPAQVVSAYDHGFYPYGQAQSLLTTRGYSDGDATILLRIAKDLIINTDTWYAFLQGDLAFADALTALVNANYADTDIINAFNSLGSAQLAARGINIQQLSDFLKSYPGGQ